MQGKVNKTKNLSFATQVDYRNWCRTEGEKVRRFVTVSNVLELPIVVQIDMLA